MPRNYFASNSELTWDVKPTEIMVNGLVAPDNYALVKSDTNQVMAIHKNSYNPFYNVEFKSLMDDLQKITNFENLSYSEFKGGKTILGYLENNSKDNIQVNGFDVNKYLVLGNTHDGSKGIFLGTSEIMLRCMNQFGKIVKSNVIKHTKNNFRRIDELKNAYEVYFKETEKQIEMFAKISKISIDQSLIDAMTKRLFDIENNEEISTRKANQIIDFNASIVSETKDLGQNLFGLFHAVTHYTTHKVKGENVVGNLFGTAYNMNEKASQFVAELV
jgi:hypothetical protein